MIFAFVLAACQPGGESDTAAVVETDSCPDDQLDCGDWMGVNEIHVTWEPGEGDSSHVVTIAVDDTDATGLQLGLAETAAGESGWYGEDCLTQGCHQFSGTTGVLTYVNSVEAVDNDHTLFNNGQDGFGDVFTADDEDRLTYMLQLDGGTDDGQCFVWGDDPAYYATAGCTEL